jgi:lipid A 3-O-deacylase
MKSGWLLSLGLLAATPADAGLWNVAWDNDLFTGTDRGYTNGLRLSWLSTAAERNERCRLCVAAGVRDGLSWLPGIGSPESDHAIAISLQQAMVTPENIELETPQYDDIPYVGYLSMDAGLYAWNRNRLTGYGITLGVTGPDSGARRTQEWVHKVTGSTDPRGWKNQLGPDVVGGIQAMHAHRFFLSGDPSEIQHEFVWGAGVTASSFISSGEVGIFWRMGRNLPGNFVPEYAGMSSSVGLPGMLDAPGAGWTVFAGLLGEANPYSYIEDKAGPYQFEQEPLVGHVSVGAGLHSNNFHFAMTVRATTAQEETNKEALTFGTLSFTWRM